MSVDGKGGGKASHGPSDAPVGGDGPTWPCGACTASRRLAVDRRVATCGAVGKARDASRRRPSALRGHEGGACKLGRYMLNHG